jgi:hypothetical protein
MLESQNNLNVLGSKKTKNKKTTKGTKQNSQNRLRSPMPEGGESQF